HHVALSGNQGSSEGVVEVALLQELPGENLLYGIATLGIDAVGEGKRQLVGIGNQVGFVEANEPVVIRSDAGHVPVGGARFNHVLEPVSEDGLLIEHARE